MSRIDQITGKKAMFGNKRSHSVIATRRRWNLNLQSIKIKHNGKVRKIKASARTIKKMKKDNKVIGYKSKKA
jgi:large subunit ribosomal protein L28